MSSADGRKLRAFAKWMEAKGICYSDGLHFARVGAGLGVKALCDFQEGDLIATIPKAACLTVRTTGAARVLQDERIAGGLGLAVALMYEQSKAEKSSWFEYLQMLPPRQSLPIAWEDHHLHYLEGTELHQVVQEDKKLIKQDWRESVLRLSKKYPHDFPLQHFTLEHYISAKTLVSSRAFEVDAFHGFGMVPLADLFNHKTGAEDVHFTRTLGIVESDAEHEFGEQLEDHEGYLSPFTNSEKLESHRDTRLNSLDNSSNFDDISNGTEDILEMILVRSVMRGTEIFNTYGCHSNAALLHRYGFTELGNPYDIINVNNELVMEHYLTLFSNRHIRKRQQIWRSFGCKACTSQSNDYFEISAYGELQLELLFLMFLIRLPDEAFTELELGRGKLVGVQDQEDWSESVASVFTSKFLSCIGYQKQKRTGEKSTPYGSVDLVDLFLSIRGVPEDIICIRDARDQAYSTDSVVEDYAIIKKICPHQHPEIFHAISLRISERCILKNVSQLLPTTGKRSKKL